MSTKARTVRHELTLQALCLAAHDADPGVRADARAGLRDFAAALAGKRGTVAVEDTTVVPTDRDAA